MFIYYSLLRRLASYKVCLCFIVWSVTVCTVWYVGSFCRDQDFVSFLSMIIYEVYIHDVYGVIFAVPGF